MKKTITYKDYVATVNFSEEDMVFFGKVIGITDSISFEGDTIESIIEDFTMPLMNIWNSVHKMQLLYKGITHNK